MSFHDSDHQFHHQVTPDTGASKTIFAKNILDKQKIKFFPKPDNLDLYTAAGEPMTVNGQVQLTATFKDKSKLQWCQELIGRPGDQVHVFCCHF